MLLGAICSVSCVRLPTREHNGIPNAMVCRSYCLRKYMECLQKFKCHRPEMKYRIPFCRDQYDKCFPTCKKELDAIDYDVGSERKLRTPVEPPVKKRGRGRPRKIRVD